MKIKYCHNCKIAEKQKVPIELYSILGEMDKDFTLCPTCALNLFVTLYKNRLDEIDQLKAKIGKKEGN